MTNTITFIILSKKIHLDFLNMCKAVCDYALKIGVISKITEKTLKIAFSRARDGRCDIACHLSCTVAIVLLFRVQWVENFIVWQLCPQASIDLLTQL